MADALKVDHWQASGLRVLVVRAPGRDRLADRLDDVRALADRHLNGCGAMLLRGFGGLDAAGFGGFAAGFGRDLLPYDFASTPRRKIESGVYSSTEYPAHQWIPQHNEQSYTRRWPMKIWFFCDVAPGEGGATPISNSRVVYRRLDAAIRARFDQRRLMYVRNYGRGLDLPWEEVFQTSDRADVEGFCRSQDIAWEWLDDGALRTFQVCQSEMRHPVTGEAVWFNQAHLFHVSGLEPAVREALLDAVDEEDLPRNVVYGDGTPIEEAVLDEIRGVYRDATFSFPWMQGDVLLLDNMLTAHGRAPFSGPRRILVAMAEAWRA